MSQENGNRLTRIFIWWRSIFVSTNTQNRQPYQDYALIILGLSMLIGLFGILAVSSSIHEPNAPPSFRVNFGLSVLIALASLLAGGFLGFLFGIPRSSQRVIGENGASDDKRYQDNTNLEQISDWLTKIIVGVGLIEIHKISTNFNLLIVSLSKGFKVGPTHFIAQTFVGSIIVYFSICGFMCVYLWSRLYLQKQLNESLRNELNEKLKQNIDLQDKKMEIQKLELKVQQFARQKDHIVVSESTEEMKRLLITAQPGPIIYFDDGQKGRWGGLSENNGLTMSASYVKSKSAEDTYIVTVRVKSISGPLVGDVYFFIHDTYYPNNIVKVTPENGFAETTFESYEAFTVGAVCNNGQIKLELDLNLDPNSPDDYKYKEPAITFDQIKSQLEKLRAE